jgi:hypothetical protein
MTDKLRRTIKKLITLNQKMLMAELKHAKETGIRHQPNKRYFKELKKQKTLLKKTDKDTLCLILSLILVETDELTRPSRLKRSALETYTKDQMISIIVNTRYLHEYLESALEKKT